MFFGSGRDFTITSRCNSLLELPSILSDSSFLVDYNNSKELAMNAFLFPLRQGRGQGLVEYAVILALVGIVVIASVRALGPRIGNTFSSINNSLGAGIISSNPSNPSNPGSFSHVANEGESFTLPAGVYEVQYGANGIYFTQFITGPATIQCNAGTFGDPNSGGVNSCSMR
jgi:pilus assembly protein Flp/PilA